MPARYMVALAVSASCSSSPPATPPQAMRPPVDAAAIAPSDAPSQDASTRPVLDSADCRALAAAPALAIATVASSETDCSSIGNQYLVFEVVRLVRGSNIARVVTRRVLYGTKRESFAVGDIFVVAIEPDSRPAQTIHCVPIPAHEGSVRHLVRASSATDAEHLVEATASCP